MSYQFFIDDSKKSIHEYHTNLPFFVPPTATFRARGMVKTHSDLRFEYGMPLGDMIHKVLQVKGVSMISLFPYKVRVDVTSKTPAEKWEDIDCIVEKCIDNIFHEGKLGLDNDTVIVDEAPDGQSRIYRFVQPISSSHGVRRISREDSESNLLEELTDHDQKLIRDILAIDGITHVEIDLRELEVHKALLFEWSDDLENKIRKVFMDTIDSQFLEFIS